MQKAKVRRNKSKNQMFNNQLNKNKINWIYNIKILTMNNTYNRTQIT